MGEDKVYVHRCGVCNRPVGYDDNWIETDTVIHKVCPYEDPDYSEMYEEVK